ncbi:Uncharacterized protein APZ42_006111, partial [Daphnia magna]
KFKKIFLTKKTTGDNGNNERVQSDEENDKIGETGNVESEEEYDGRWDKGIGSQKIRQSDNESVRSEEENFEIWGGGNGGTGYKANRQ